MFPLPLFYRSPVFSFLNISFFLLFSQNLLLPFSSLSFPSFLALSFHSLHPFLIQLYNSLSIIFIFLLFRIFPIFHYVFIIFYRISLLSCLDLSTSRFLLLLSFFSLSTFLYLCIPPYCLTSDFSIFYQLLSTFSLLLTFFS